MRAQHFHTGKGCPCRYVGKMKVGTEVGPTTIGKWRVDGKPIPFGESKQKSAKEFQWQG